MALDRVADVREGSTRGLAEFRKEGHDLFSRVPRSRHCRSSATLLQPLKAIEARVVGMSAEGVLHRRFDQTRSECIDVGVRQLSGVELGEHVQGGLGQSVTAPPSMPVHGGPRGDENQLIDANRSGDENVDQDLIRPDVDIEEVRQIFERGFLEISNLAQHSRVEEHDIEMIDVIDKGSDSGRNLFENGKIDLSKTKPGMGSKVSWMTARKAIHRVLSIEKDLGQTMAQPGTHSGDEDLGERQASFPSIRSREFSNDTTISSARV